jgi:hypothetical protein
MASEEKEGIQKEKARKNANHCLIPPLANLCLGCRAAHPGRSDPAFLSSLWALPDPQDIDSRLRVCSSHLNHFGRWPADLRWELLVEMRRPPDVVFHFPKCAFPTTFGQLIP